MPTIQQLKDKRANVWEQMKGVMDLAEREGRGLSAEEQGTYDSAETELDQIGDQIERQERHDARAAEMGRVNRDEVVPNDVRAERATIDEARYREAFVGMLRHGVGELDAEQKKLMRSGYTTLSETRAGGVGTSAAGGYTVPPGFRTQVIEQVRTFGGMLDVAEVLDTDTGNPISWPTNDDTANVGAILAENTQVTEQDVVFGTAQLGAYKYTTKMVRISSELLQDSAFDIETWLSRKLAERIGRILNQHFTTGTGSSQPQGIVTGIGVGKVGAAGQTTTITYDDLIDLIDSVDPAYQANAAFMFSQASRKAVRKLKDTTNQPLWQPSVQAGVPDQLLGYAYTINQDLPAPAANAKSVLFGDFKQAYVIRSVRDLAVRRLDERFADYDQRAFLGFSRYDGLVQNASAAKAYQQSAT